jgi:KaiC/GvpD/RAD55 family RecA-like ATPase
MSMRASRITPKQQEYVLPGYIPRGTLTMIAGKRNAGKSLMATWLAEALTIGQVPDVRGNIVKQAPVDVWINSREDPVQTVLAPRVYATKADKDRVILSGHHWTLPNSVGAIRDELVRIREKDGLDPAVLILDSMNQHFYNPGHGHVQNRDAMDGLKTFAEDYDLSIVFVHHLVKGKHATVESMIGGMSVLQTLSKTIYVYGGYPQQTSATGVLACERHGYGPTPISLGFERVTRTVRGLGQLPFLDYVGPMGVSAMDVLKVAKKDEKGTGGSGQSQAAEFIRKHIKDSGLIGKPIKTVQLEAAAKDNDCYFSKGTFGRARDQAGLRALNRSELERRLGKDFVYLTDAEKRSGWVLLDGGLEDGDAVAG